MGFIKIGNNSAVLDNATIQANPAHATGSPGVFIGNSTIVSLGATVQGPATVGSLAPTTAPTYVGPNALIDGATIEPGAYVSGMARVGPGVIVPTGIKVLPGVNVTITAQASNPALGFVVPMSANDVAAVKRLVSWNAQLAAGYSNLYQGNSATGASPGTSTKNVFNGDLATVEGAGPEPGPSNGANFEPSSASPQFPSPRGTLLPGNFFNFRARSTGAVNFHARAYQVAHHLGYGNAIRGDGGQPVKFAGYPTTGNHVSINAPAGNTVTIGTSLQAGTGAVLVADFANNLVLGNNDNIGAGAVVSGSTLGDNVTIGPRAYVSDSNLPSGAVVPGGVIMVNNKITGKVQW
jgi:carbonic anhydrase/acetyltransferase-like protein (isoleucine patch superfamily)